MTNNTEKKIRVAVMCMIMHNGRILLGSRATLKSKNLNSSIIPSDSYRMLSGGLWFGETTENCVRREIKEELGSEVENLQLVEVFEDRYVYHDAEGHDIVFLFKADLVDKTLYEKEVIHIDEETYEFDAVWIPIPEILDGTRELHPRHDFSKYF